MEDMEFYKSAANSALTNGTGEKEVTISFGELFLFHTLLQVFGLQLLEEEKFLELMERNVARIDSFQKEDLR